MTLACAWAAPPSDDPAPVFDSAYLLGSGKELDTARFDREGALPPGIYRVDVSINGEWMGAHDIRFASTDAGRLDACLEHALLSRMGVSLDPSARDGAETGLPLPACRPIHDWVPHATARLDSSELRLEIGVPQAAMRRRARGDIDTADWDAGIPVGIFEYNASHFRVSGTGGDYRSSFLGMTAGVNLGYWQLRHVSSLSWQPGSQRQWRRLASYAERPLPQWRSRLTLGERVSADPLLGAVGFRGLQLDSDERMFPESRRGFAPVVRGVAEGNAQVEIRQHGNTIRKLSVAAGPFEIHDLYALDNGADLEVIVTEADGRIMRSFVPYAFNPHLVRAGTWRYKLVAGQVSEPLFDRHPKLVTATAHYGFSNALTGYGAAVSSDGYNAGLAGAAFNIGIGALSLDVAKMRTCCGQGGNGERGLRWRASYNHALGSGGAVLSASLSHYPEPGFRELRDTLQGRTDAERFAGSPLEDSATFPRFNPVRGIDWDAPGRTYTRSQLRNSLQASFSLPLGERGALYLNGFHDRRADGGGRSGYQAGFRGYLRRISYVLSAGRTEVSDGRHEDRYLLSVSVPLQRPASSPMTVYGAIDHRSVQSSQRIGMSGVLGQEAELGYGLSLSRRGGDTTYAGNLLYRSPMSTLNASASAGSDYRQVALGAEGVALFHAGGITLGGQRGDTLALVEAPEARGVRIANVAGARIDRRGYGIAPFLLPYTRNMVELDPASASNVEISGNVHTVVPYAGAVVKASFESRRSDAILMLARRSDGRSLPFAAEVMDARNEVVGVVAQGSRLYVHTAIADEGQLQVRWGPAPSERCVIHYRWSPEEAATGLRQFPGELRCQAERE